MGADLIQPGVDGLLAAGMIEERRRGAECDLSLTTAGTAAYDLIDQDGVVVRSVRVRPASLPVYQTTAAPGSLRGDPAVAAVVAVLREAPASVAKAVVAVAAANAQDVKLGLSNGVTIVWGNTSGAKEKAAELAILMRTHARYYDVSAPGTAVTIDFQRQGTTMSTSVVLADEDTDAQAVPTSP